MGTTDISFFFSPNATKIFLRSVTALRHSADGLLHTRTHLEVFTTEVGLDLHKEKTKRQVEACLSICLTIFWLSVVRPSFLPSVSWPINPRVYVTKSRDHRTPSHVSENCKSLAARLELGIDLSQGLYLRRTT